MKEKIVGFLKERLAFLVPFFVYLLLGLGAWKFPDLMWGFLLAHIPLMVFLLFPLLARLGWFLVDYQRKQAALDTKRTVEPPPRLRPFRQAWREWWELSFFIDEPAKIRRNLILTVLMLVAVVALPVGRVAPGVKPISEGGFSEGWGLTGLGVQGAIVPFLALFVWWGLLAHRAHQVYKERELVLESIYEQAAIYLKYPIKKRGLRKSELPFQNHLGSIQVKKWKTLEEPEEFFVKAPASLDATLLEPWESLQNNMDVRFPQKTGWHVEKDKRMTGATFMPSSYPTSVVWNGEYFAEDPLRFYLGADLDSPGENLTFTLGTTSPHLACTGGTGAGKSSTAEAILCQLAIKPMPWSLPDDPIFGSADIIDPKGPFANRWEGRPNMKVVNGNKDYVGEDGEPVSGIEKMTEAVVAFEEEMSARGRLIDSYGVAKWLDLPEDVLRKERMAPRIIVLDEYLDHADKISGGSEQAKRDNEARQILQEKVLLIARKGRSYGYHIILIAQMANMTALGSALMRQLVARVIMGNMDPSSYQSMFGDRAQVPTLPTTQLDENGKVAGIPGRGRLMNAPGMTINRFQAFWFGGKENDETLNKYLPKQGEETSALLSPSPNQENQADINEVITGTQESQYTCAYCKNLPKYTCTQCPKKLCMEHSRTLGDEKYCAEHFEKHPLSAAGLADLYSYAKDHAEKTGATVYWNPTGGGLVKINILDSQGNTIGAIEAGNEQPVVMMEANNFTEGKQKVHSRLKELLTA